MKTKRLHQFDILVNWLEEYLLINGYRSRTIQSYLHELSLFRRWLAELPGFHDLDELHKDDLHNYTLYLFSRNLAPKTIHCKLTALKCFFTALYEENKLYKNLATAVTLPRIGKRLPTNILTEEDTEKLFAILEAKTDDLIVRDLFDALLIRNRLLLELLYSCGLRSGEIRNLTLDSIEYGKGLLTVLNGKGGKDRVIPVGSVALNLLERYVAEARPLLATKGSGFILLLSRRGNMLSVTTLGTVVSTYVKEAGIEKHIRVHDLRHTCATHMLNAGADIRYVQELLGHKSLSSTQLYTHVAIDKLKKSHNTFHPRERWLE